MRIAVVAALALGGCAANGLPTPQTQQALILACKVDGVVVPIGQDVVGQLGAAGATASGIDQLLVHPLVLKACEQQNGTPAAVPAVTVAQPSVQPLPQPPTKPTS